MGNRLGTVPQEVSMPAPRIGPGRTGKGSRIAWARRGEAELIYFLGVAAEERSKSKEFDAPSFTSAVRVVAVLYRGGIGWPEAAVPALPSISARCLLSAASAWRRPAMPGRSPNFSTGSVASRLRIDTL